MSGARRPRAGMTLVEVMIALLVLGAVVTIALGAMDDYGRVFRVGSDRMLMLQNFRYAANTLERDLRTAGSGVPAHQPYLVYADTSVIVFNADHTSRIVGDPFAFFINPGLPDSAVNALPYSRRITLPNTSVAYPDTTYTLGPGSSPAETLIFWFAPDTTTPRGDDFALWRQVNDLDPELIARDLVRSAAGPFLAYERLVVDSGEVGLAAVASAALPLRHLAAIHLSPADTAGSAALDSVRAVRVRLAVSNGLTGAREERTELERLVRLPNAGLDVLRTCGAKPIFAQAVTAAVVTSGGGPAVQLGWAAATDETEGERDVVRYVIWRRPAGGSGWTDPYVSVPAGLTNYTYVDTRVLSGESFDYAVAAQDCTPETSTIVTAGPVIVP